MNLVREVALALTIFVLLILWPTTAKAEVTHFLLVLLNGQSLAVGTAGQPIPFDSLEKCQDLARKANAVERDMLKPHNGEYVCLKIERVPV